jgi:hypothetical protein
MFEILKALRDLNTACMAHGTSLRWHMQTDEPEFPMLLAEIPLKPEDNEFVEQMQAMFAPVEEG